MAEEKKTTLEEAAEEYGNYHNDDCFDATGDRCPHIRKAFIAGAEWQEKQDLRWAGEIHKNGYNLCKEQMLKDAVEGYVNYYEDSGGILMAEAQVGCPYHSGDKVKIVIVKED